MGQAQPITGKASFVQSGKQEEQQSVRENKRTIALAVTTLAACAYGVYAYLNHEAVTPSDENNSIFSWDNLRDWGLKPLILGLSFKLHFVVADALKTPTTNLSVTETLLNWKS